MQRTFVFLTLIFATFNSWAFEYTVEVTEQQLQQQLARIMPVQQEKYFVTVVLSDPVLELAKEGNEVGLFANIKMMAPGGIQGSGRAKVMGGISYKKETGSFYLDNPKIAHLEVDQIPAQFHENIKELAQMALSNSMANRALFTLRDENVQEKLAKSVLQSVKIASGKIVMVLQMN